MVVGEQQESEAPATEAREVNAQVKSSKTQILANTEQDAMPSPTENPAASAQLGSTDARSSSDEEPHLEQRADSVEETDVQDNAGETQVSPQEDQLSDGFDPVAGAENAASTGSGSTLPAAGPQFQMPGAFGSPFATPFGAGFGSYGYGGQPQCLLPPPQFASSYIAPKQSQGSFAGGHNAHLRLSMRKFQL